jgi:hypothetical protein
MVTLIEAFGLVTPGITGTDVSASDYAVGSGFTRQCMPAFIPVCGAFGALKKLLDEEAAAQEQQQKVREQQQKLQKVFDKVSSQSNVAWSLHMLLIGVEQFGLGLRSREQIQVEFGWTLSFSRAMHGGKVTMKAWFESLGVNLEYCAQCFQCARQAGDASKLLDSVSEPTNIPGVQRVMSTYSTYSGADHTRGADVQRVTALLMMAPTVESALQGKDGVFFEDVKVDGVTISLPYVSLGVEELRPRVNPLKSNRTLLRRTPLILTPPRIALCMRIAKAMDKELLGVQLTGVHGAGKTTFLAGLSTVLPVGFPCDVMYVPNAGKLLNKEVGLAAIQSACASAWIRALGLWLTGAHQANCLLSTMLLPTTKLMNNKKILVWYQVQQDASTQLFFQASKHRTCCAAKWSVSKVALSNLRPVPYRATSVVKQDILRVYGS